MAIKFSNIKMVSRTARGDIASRPLSNNELVRIESYIINKLRRNGYSATVSNTSSSITISHIRESRTGRRAPAEVYTRTKYELQQLKNRNNLTGNITGGR